MEILRWRHIVINTRGSWLHGDERGFRSRGHRIHSSGDYRNPPPPSEHAGLRHYMQEPSTKEVAIPLELRPVMGRAVVEWCLDNRFVLHAFSINEFHGHGLIELVDDIAAVRKVVGELKRISSKSVRSQIPGSIWAAGGTYKPIADDAHFANADDYILFKQSPDAWTWSLRDTNTTGMLARDRPKPPHLL